ncbi:hypothetical protein TNCT_34891 [Trichonephila clavata]|uniref:Uncharacterized protein n=1 Tax=Trichonephila clavata TaxID=2740835 RepID=A0A8X6LFL4_TRICU|nr:hypothetical protein TNCT_34891 [Trichonephila clavata]
MSTPRKLSISGGQLRVDFLISIGYWHFKTVTLGPFPYQQLQMEALQAVFPKEITFEWDELSLYYHISPSGF